MAEVVTELVVQLPIRLEPGLQGMPRLVGLVGQEVPVRIEADWDCGTARVADAWATSNGTVWARLEVRSEPLDKLLREHIDLRHFSLVGNA